MTKRELVLEHIRIEVATEGKVTARALALYVGNRIGYEAFHAAIDRGMEQYKKIHKGKTA